MEKALLQAFFFVNLVATIVSANFMTDVEVTWGSTRAKVLENGNTMQLSMDRSSGSGFQSKQEYLFGRFDVQMKLVPGNSAGTVTTLYLSSQGSAHDELDFEFLGNVSGQPYVLHTNVYSKGQGNREQQFYLWFDPIENFHTYSFVWNPRQTVFYVDRMPIRIFRNNERLGVPYLNTQPMRVYGSIWDGEDWATRGGLDKTDWSQAPFVATYRTLNADACVASGGSSTCSPSKGNWWDQGLDASGEQKLKWVQQNYMIYNYCKDTKRFPQGFPTECSLPLN